MIIKIWNGTGFVENYAKTTVSKIVASGDPDNTNYLRGDGVWDVPKIPGSNISDSNPIYFVNGNTTGTSGAWTGTIQGITEYYEGLRIDYKIGINGASTTTLNINGIGASICYRYSTSKITTHYKPNYIIPLVYTNINGGCWMISGDTYDIPSAHNHSATNITSGTLSVARGGTGRGTIDSNKVLVGNGTSAVSMVSRDSIDTRSFFPTNASSIVASGTPSSSTYLRGDGTWATPPGGGGGSAGWTEIVNVQLNDLVPGDGSASASYTVGTYTEFWILAGAVGMMLNPANTAHYMIPSSILGEYVARSLPGYGASDMNISPVAFTAGWDKSGYSSAPNYRLMVYAR